MAFVVWGAEVRPGRTNADNISSLVKDHCLSSSDSGRASPTAVDSIGINRKRLASRMRFWSSVSLMSRFLRTAAALAQSLRTGAFGSIGLAGSSGPVSLAGTGANGPGAASGSGVSANAATVHANEQAATEIQRVIMTGTKAGIHWQGKKDEAGTLRLAKSGEVALGVWHGMDAEDFARGGVLRGVGGLRAGRRRAGENPRSIDFGGRRRIDLVFRERGWHPPFQKRC